MNLDQLLKRRPQASAEPARVATPGLDVGRSPRVSLLPTELRSAVHERAVKRSLAGAVVVALLIAAGGTAVAATAADLAQARADRAQSASTALARQVAKFRDVQALQHSVALGNAAVSVGGSTEVDWRTQLALIERDMPAGYRVLSVSGDSATPLADYPQGTTPIEMPRVATVRLTVGAPSLELLPMWLRKLRSIASYADAEPSVSSDSTGAYSVDIDIHLDKEAIVQQAAQGSGQ